MSLEETKPTAATATQVHQTHGASIDWPGLYQRLRASQAALARRLAPGPEEKQKILRARARSLAAHGQAENVAPHQRLQLVEFILGSEHYAIESGHIREILPLSEFTPLPCTPAFVLGLVNLRGQLLSIINIKRLFDLPEKGLTDLNQVIIVQGRQMEVGILADAILGVGSVAVEELHPSLPTLTGIRAEYLKGITKDLRVVLDIENILADRRLIVDEEVGIAT